MVSRQGPAAETPRSLAAVLNGAAKALDMLRVAPAERLARLREAPETPR